MYDERPLCFVPRARGRKESVFCEERRVSGGERERRM